MELSLPVSPEVVWPFLWSGARVYSGLVRVRIWLEDTFDRASSPPLLWRSHPPCSCCHVLGEPHWYQTCFLFEFCRVLSAGIFNSESGAVKWRPDKVGFSLVSLSLSFRSKRDLWLRFLICVPSFNQVSEEADATLCVGLRGEIERWDLNIHFRNKHGYPHTPTYCFRLTTPLSARGTT